MFNIGRDIPRKLKGGPNRETNCYANKAQMQYDKYRQQGMQIGSGVVESAGRQIVGLRTKRPGSHWSVTGANAVLVIKCFLTNHRWVDFLHWKAQQAVAA